MTVAGGSMASELSSGTATNHGGEEETQLTLPPAFRFDPTDEEVLLHYLRKRSLSRPVIADVDLNKIEPWDLPGEPKLGVQEWYFFSFKDRKYPTGMRTNRATVSSYCKATGKDKEIISSHHAPHGGKTPWVHVSTPIEHEAVVDVSDGDTRMRLRSTCDVVRDKIGIPLATRLGMAIGCAEALAYMHSSWHPYSIDHTDLKPSNILLDSKMEPNINDFGLSRLLQFMDHTQIPMGSEVPSHNRPLDAKFSGKSSAKQDIEIKIGSHMTHRQRYLSVHRHPLIKMLLPVRKWSGDIFTSCARLITSNRIFGMPETGWISGKPKYEIPNAGPVPENIIRKLFGIRKGLTVNESQQQSDASRSDHGKMPMSRKTSASWIIATGAPHHATGNRNLLSGFIMEHDDQFVHAVNRVPMKVLARGAVVTDTLILPDVWFVPGLTENLVSVSQLAELDHAIGFGRGECCIKSARDARIVGVGRLQKGGHYELDFLKVPLAI